MKKKNRGFTLIELIVTVAIMAIFSGVVLSMIGTGANSYRKTSSTAKAQMETQDVMDQIQNMIIDVNRSVYYSYGKGINEGYGDEIRNDIDSGDSSQSKLSSHVVQQNWMQNSRSILIHVILSNGTAMNRNCIMDAESGRG